MICPPDHPHGASNVCYVKHGCRCDDCTRFNTEYAYWRRYQMEPLTVSADPSRRRIQALAAIGWTRSMLAHEAGVKIAMYHNTMQRNRIHRHTHALIAAQYERLCMRLPSPVTAHSRELRKSAVEKGWLPPLAWEDIEAGLAA